MKVFNVILILTWILGMIFVYISPEISMIFWAVPAGIGAGTALAELVENYKRKNNESSI